MCPSEWYENFPFSITESFVLLKPVVGANIGGIPELVIDGKTRLLFTAGDVLDLREKLLKLWADDTLINQIGAAARKHAYSIFNFNTHWEKLHSVLSNLNIHDK